MPSVWIVTQTYDNYTYVNDYLDIGEADMVEIVGVFVNERDARELQRSLQKQNLENMKQFDADPVTILVTEWSIQ